MSVNNTTSSQFSACQFYKVKLNPADGTPLLTTMQAYHNNQIADPCTEAWLPPYQMSHTGQCFPKNHLRYFYLLNKQTGRIVPNSLFSHIGKPMSMCQGVNVVLEYVIHSS